MATNWWSQLPQASAMDAALAAEGVSGPLAQLAQSVYMQESSGGKNTRTSNAGAVGGMQIIPSTFASVADEGWDINDPVHNARAGIRYLKQMQELGGGDPRMAAIGYYGGPGAIRAAQSGQARRDPRNPNAPNTFEYADQVLGRVQSGRKLGPIASALDRAAQTVFPAAQASENWWESLPMAGPQQSGDWYSSMPLAEGDAIPTGQTMPLGQVNIHSNPDPAPSGGGVVDGLLMGMRDPIDAGAQMLRRAVPESIGQAVDRAGNRLADMGLPVARSEGVEGVDALVNQANEQYDAARAKAGRDGFDWARLGGNIVGSTPLIAATPGMAGASLPARMSVGAAQGGALGLFAPVVGEEDQQDFSGEKSRQAMLGAALGSITPALVGGAARLISPNASRPNSPAQLLKREGIELTPGQAAGGVTMRMEDRAMSMPIVGDAIRSARGRANEQLNRAVYNRVLEPIGKTTDKIGREAVEDVAKKVSQAYDDVLGKVHFRADNAFQQNLARLSEMAAELPEKEATQFTRVLSREVLGPLSKGQAVDGFTFKRIEAQLGERAQSFLKSTDAYQQDLGRALIEVQRALRENLMRLNPQQAAELRNVNASFAQLVRLQNAAGRIGAQEGVFTPQQFAQAIRQTDRSTRKSAYAKGRALMQDLSDAAQSRMSAKIPDSGTAERAMNAGALASALVSPWIPAGLGAAALPYLPGAVRASTGAITNRPHSAQLIADVLRKLPPGALGLLAE